MAKKLIKLNRDLQLGDPFFIIESSPADDHKGVFANSPVNYFSLKEETVKGISYHERDETILLIKGKTQTKPYTAPAEGNNRTPEIGDVISDEDLAYEVALKLTSLELIKAKQLLSVAEKVVEGVESNAHALKTRAPYGAKATNRSNEGSDDYMNLLAKDLNEHDDKSSDDVRD